MNESKIAVRYAKALFLFAKEKALLGRIRDDIELIYETAQKIQDFNILIESPLLKTKDKTKAFKELFGKKISEETESFINLVLKNKRETYITDMARNFLDIYRKDKGIKKAQLTSAVKIDDRIVKKITDEIKQHFNAEIELNEVVDKNIIGGFILRIEDQQVDASVLAKLKNIKQELLETNLN